MRSWFLGVILAGLGAGCAGIERFDTPLEPRDPWVRVTPDADVLARIEAARDYSREHGGRSLLVLQGEEVLFEDYYNGHSASTPWPLWSGTKTFSCMLFALGQEQGLFTLDERVADTVTEWQGVEHKQDITVEHLLRFTSGLKTAPWALSVDGFKAVENQRIDDKYSHALGRPSRHPPRDVWEYGSVHLTAFGAFLERKLERSPLDWLREHVLAPIDFRVSGWNHDPNGNPMLPYGAWTTTPELSKFGAVLRDDGLYQGVRVLPEGTLAACMVPGVRNPAYGLSAWLNEEMGEGVTFADGNLNQHGEGTALLAGGPPMLAAAGARGQRVVVIPSLDWVVVHQCDSNRFRDPEFFARLLGSD